ncbi:PAS domain-containing sensor histidine kinase [Desulfopila sp. IMCC35008]|uniref:PAS domain-containing hybrid sensor histidine kinase/response regulator n=1 Tax=Desulfopila sp. IMCC35008 TaxID=2653858 RepID=UPI0013D74EC2|nr:PAS domain-containing sensor histidine kinase [Desulfopila sp. IMCC35008]
MFSLKRYLSYVIVAVSLALTLATFFYGLRIVNDLQDLRSSEVSLFQKNRELEQNFREFQRALGLGGFIHNVKEYLINRKSQQLFILRENIEEIQKAYVPLRIQFEKIESVYAIKTLDEFVALLQQTYQILSAPENQHLDTVELNNLLDLENPRFLSAIVTLESLKNTYDKESIQKIKTNIDALVFHLLFASVLLPVILAIGGFLSWLLNRAITGKQMIEAAHQKLKVADGELIKSEEKYRDLIDSSPDLHYRTDTEGRIVFISPSVQRISGYTVEELIGMKMEELYVNPEERKIVLAILQKDGFVTEYETQIKRKNGSVWWASTNAHFFKDNDGHILGVGGVTRDVTERKQVEEVLRETKERLATFMDSATDGFILFDSDFYHLEMNKAAFEITGLKRKNVIGKNLIEVIPNIQETSQYDSYKKVMETGEPYHVTDLTQHPLTGDKYIELKAFKVGDGIGVIFSDITERKQIEKEKIQLERRLQQAQKMEAIGTLAGGIAHDFNNILAAILGYAEMAKDDSQPESTVAKDLDKVLEAGNRAKDLVQQILSFSRQNEMERITLQPVSVVKDAIKMLRPSLPTTIEINQDIPPATGLILADPTQIHQILMNLCTNAFHAIEETGGKLGISLKEVTLSIEDLVHEPDVEAGTFVQLSISDSGSGIPPEIKKNIFDPYFTTKEPGKGTGMGLAIVHGIVKSYGGFISLYSEPGEGTAFHVFIPVIEKELLPEIEDAKPTPVGRERILFIDDEEILAEMGKSMLERLGYHVTVRNNSIEALETFRNQPELFDLVITDQTMPGMTGADIARRMIHIRPDIPIILCTGYSTTISEEKAKSMGIKEFALKPLSKKDIAVLIRKVLDNS